MPIQTTKNLYRGINPHLSSLLQAQASPLDFRAFHAAFITQLMAQLNRHLPMEYIAVSETSMQFVRPPDDHFPPHLETVDYENGFADMGDAPLPTWQGDVFSTIEPLASLSAVKIHVAAARPVVGKLVAAIELLSPSNKLGGAYDEVYRARRIEHILSRVPLIEIDLLHETPPIVARHPVYPQQADSYPYYVAFSDARSQAASVRVYGFGINQTAPRIYIPLLGADYVVIDIDEVYQTVFQVGHFGSYIDYTQVPERFDCYSAADQQRIKTCMTEITTEFGEAS